MAYPAYTAGAAVERKPTSTYGYGHPGYERGWGIKWFASAMEAATHDAESRQAAVTFVRTRKTLVELTEDLPLAELPAQPPVEAPFAPTLAEAMGWLGFTPEQFQVAETPGPRVEVVRGTSYYSELREDWRQIEPDREVFHWFERENEIIVLYHNLTVDQLIGGRWERNALPVARKFAPPEVIEEARTVRERLRQKHEDGQRAERRRFLEAVREHSVFPCLPIGLQGDIEKMLESLNNGFLSIAKLAQEIAEQWATAARLLERQRRGEICVNFGGILHVSGVSGDARFFVIQADGELRAPETGSFSKSHGRGAQTQVWSLVGPDELAIAWKGHRARVSQGDFRVSKLPVDGLSPAQIEAVRRIEEELRAIPNSFGLDPKLSDEQGLAMEAVRTAYHEVTSQGLPEDVRYRHVVDSGFDCTAHVESWMEREIDRTESFDRQIAGREAQAVWEIECAGGVLEFLAFHKFGHWNFSCRWRTLDAEEI